MKRILFFAVAAMLVVNANSQSTTVVWLEDFNNRTLWEGTFPPEGWTSYDNDGDAHRWEYTYKTTSQNGYLFSASWEDPNPLTPDNWIVTPPLDLTTVETNATLVFKWGVRPTANTPQYRTEHYGVFISSTNNQIPSFVMVYEETLSEQASNLVLAAREIDLSSYIGQSVYIAFRHWQSTDKDAIVVDDFSLEKSVPANIDNQAVGAINIYPNPATDYLIIVAENFQKAEIYNAIGQMVQESHDNQINIYNLNRGVYLVKVYHGNKVSYLKVMINK